MNCKYKIGNTIYTSYQDLINNITDDQIKEYAAVLFSLDADNNLYDKLKSLSHEYAITHRKDAFMDDSDIDAGENFTTQTFIDSGYFLVNGKPPMFRLDFNDYTNSIKEEQKELINRIDLRDSSRHLQKSISVINSYLIENYNYSVSNKRIRIEGKQVTVWIISKIGQCAKILRKVL